MSSNEWKNYCIQEITINHDKRRRPLSSKERNEIKGQYPYYGAQGIIDSINDYIFDGVYLLIAEDGENLKSLKQPVAQLARGKFWVNNHAHILTSNHLSDIRFLCYLFNITDIAGYITGSVQPKLSQQNLNAIRLKIPPILDQKAIVNTLSCLDDMIELNNRTNQLLEEMAQAIFKQWFVEFEFPNEDGLPYKSSGGEMVDSELGEIPEGWRYITINEYCSRVTDGAHNSPPAIDKSDFIIATVKDMDDFGLKLESCKRISEQNYHALVSQNCNPETGDVLISKDGTMGKVLLFDGQTNLVLLSSIAILSANPGVSHHYLFRFLRYPATQNMFKDGFSSGSVLKRVVLKDLKRMPLALPSTNILNAFDKIMAPLHSGIQNRFKQNQSLSAIRDTLLPKLMSGEIRVPIQGVV